MKIYNFEYYNRKYALNLYGICLLTFASIFSCFFLIKDYINFVFYLLFLFGIPSIIYFSKRSKIKAYCEAIVYSDWVEFKLKNETMKINFCDINSYLIQYYNGTVLNLKLKKIYSMRLLEKWEWSISNYSLIHGVTITPHHILHK